MSRPIQAGDPLACPRCGEPRHANFCAQCGYAFTSDEQGTGRHHIEPATEPLARIPGTAGVAAVRAGAPVANAQAWSAGIPPGRMDPSPDVDGTGLFPGWAGIHPPVALAVPDRSRTRATPRRRAWWAVLAVVTTTALIVTGALFLAPAWTGRGDRGDNADKQGRELSVGPSPTSSSVPSRPFSSPSPSPRSSAPDSTPGSSAGSSPGPVSASPGSHVARSPRPASPGPRPGRVSGSPAPAATTVVVSASSAAVRPSGPTPAPRPPAPVSPPIAPSPPVRSAPPSPPARTATPSPVSRPAAQPLGVPQRNIACGTGYFVQLASETSAPAFADRVRALQAAGRVPSAALASDTRSSCGIFGGQTNLVLYTGMYSSPYDGCAARLAGPADAFIRTSTGQRQWISCLCPATVSELPALAPGSSSAWVGEMQRVLGHLNIPVSGLSGHWGDYTESTAKAVARFQKRAKLPVTGRVDGPTWAALQGAVC